MKVPAIFAFGAVTGLAFGGAAGTTVNFLTMTNRPAVSLNAGGVAFGVDGLCWSDGKMWEARRGDNGSFVCLNWDKPQ